MKKFFLLLIFVLIGSNRSNSQNLKDSVGVVNAAVHGYVGAWFTANADAMARSLHPAMVKYRVTSPTTVSSSTTSDLLSRVGSRTPTTYESINLQYEILDIAENVAAVKVTNNSFFDLVYVTKHDTTWLVTNVAWDNNSVASQSTGEEVVNFTREYITAIYSGNDSLMSKILHPMVDIRRPVSFDQVEKVNYDWIVEKTRNKEFGYIPAGSLNVEIELLVIYKSYACVKLTSPGGTEYLHLRYFNPNWYIVNGIWERNASVTTGVRQNEQVTPGAFQLSQNYPNPFNPSTIIQYTLQEPGNVVLKIFNLIGEEVDILVEGFQSTGNYQVKWQPQAHASGIYLYQLQVGEFIQAKKLIFQR